MLTFFKSLTDKLVIKWLILLWGIVCQRARAHICMEDIWVASSEVATEQTGGAGKYLTTVPPHHLYGFIFKCIVKLPDLTKLSRTAC